MSSLLSVWPTEQQKLSIEANAMDPVTLLAVHQPMRFRRVGHKQAFDHGTTVDEHAILKALLDHSDAGRTIVPIKGLSGSGKSHVIRWLESQLSQRADRANREVIVASKTMSLAEILRTLLEKLPSTKDYNNIRAHLATAAATDPLTVAINLGSALGLALQKEQETAAAINVTNRSPEEELYADYGVAIDALVRDPVFIDQVLYTQDKNSPFRRVTRHMDTARTHDDEHVFKAEDFELNTDDIHTLKQSVNQTARRMVSRLGNPVHRKQVADLLNLQLDGCIQQLIDQSLQGRSLIDLFLDLRKALLQDKKELVILIEDFGVLTGMQNAILDAVIQEADIAGETRYCPIRSAIAYTSNKHVERDTIQTRAVYTWHIEPTDAHEDAIVERATALVAAYWNAARWPLKDLKTQYKASEDGKWKVDDFVTKHVDLSTEHQEQLQAFGQSSAGYPLFPFTKTAIRQFVKEYSTEGGQTVYNPRKLVTHLVIQFIALYKDQYAQAKFPPSSGFENAKAQITAPDVLNAITATTDANAHARLRAFVAFWGAEPGSCAEAAQIPKEIYEVFALLPPDFGTPPPRRKTTTGPGGIDPPPPPPPPSSTPWAAWFKELDSWQKDKNYWLPQAKANELRKWIAAAILKSISPDWPGTKYDSLTQTDLVKRIFLPDAFGQKGLEEPDATITLCNATIWRKTDQALRVREHLEALIKRETANKWPESDPTSCAAHYANFVSTYREQVLKWLHEHRESINPLEDLVCTRLLAAAVLGHSSQTSKETLDLVVQEPGPEPQPSGTWDEDWQTLHKNAYTAFKDLYDPLLRCLAARQGTSLTPYAFDTTELRRIATAFVKTYESSGVQFKQFHRNVDRERKKRQTTVTAWLQDSKNWFPDEHPFDDVIAQIKTTRSLVQTYTLGDTNDLVRLREHINKLETAASTENLTECIKHANTVAKADSSTGPVLVAVAKTSTTYRLLMVSMRTLFDDLTTHYKNVERTLKQRGSGDAGDAYAQQQQATRTLLTQVQSTLMLEEEGTE